jgi:flagellar FliL protein
MSTPLVFLPALFLFLNVYAEFFLAQPGLSMAVAHASSGGGSSASNNIALEPFLVNLADPGGRRYLKVKLTLELDHDKNFKKAEKSLPAIRDAIIMTLSSKKFVDLSTLDGKQNLRQEILVKMATIVGDKIIAGVYYNEFIIQ